MSEWKPIETAPQDGTLIRLRNGSSIYNGVYISEYTEGWETEKGTWASPTHWQPLPEPPLASSKPE